MSIWLDALCRNSLGEINPDDLRNGIAKRLRALTYLYCPEDEEEPDVVLSRMRIEAFAQRQGVWILYARKEPDRFIRIERSRVNSNHEEIQEQLQRLDDLADQERPELQQIREFLYSVKEVFLIELKSSDLETMAWPVAVAAAAWFAEMGSGFIRNEDNQWLVPNNRDVTLIFNPTGG